MDCSMPVSSVHGDTPGKNTRVGCHAHLQRIFPTQGSSLGLPLCKQICYYLSHKGSPGILAWVAYPFSRWTPLPRNWTRVSCLAGRFFTSWAIREALVFPYKLWNYLFYFCENTVGRLIGIALNLEIALGSPTQSVTSNLLSHVQLFVTPRTVPHQAPLFMGILQARILEWVSIPSSRGSSQPRDFTQVSCTSGRFFTVWATREAQE